MGFLELCVVIIYIVAMDMGWYSYTQRINYSIRDFWRIYNFQFGLITPFIGAVLSIVGAIIGKLNSREIIKINSLS